MSKRLVYLILAVFCFLSGAYVWKILRTGRLPSELDQASSALNSGQRQGSIVEVGGTPISSDDLEWEFSLHTRGILKNEELTPIPDLGNRLEKELGPLRQKLMTGIIERKMLYKFIQQDKRFDIQDPGRYSDCLQQWQQTVAEEPGVYTTASDKERLKNRMCERSLITQYLKERIFGQVGIKDAEVVEYFKNHSQEFKLPSRAVVRQIVLADEKTAKIVKGKLSKHNFAELAKEYSIAPEAAQGGRLGPFAKGEFPSFFNIVFDMQPGQTTDILKSTYGFHIIMLTEKVPHEQLSLAQATPKIRTMLLRQKEEEEYKKWVELALHTVSISTPKPLW